MVAALIPIAAALAPTVIDFFRGLGNHPATPAAGAATPSPIAAATAMPAAPPPLMISDVQQPPATYVVTQQGRLGTVQSTALNNLAAQQRGRANQAYQAQVARSQVRHVNAAIDPQLAQITAMLRRQQEQTRATTEHRKIIAQQRFQRQVLGRLASIDRYIPRY